VLANPQRSEAAVRVGNIRGVRAWRSTRAR